MRTSYRSASSDRRSISSRVSTLPIGLCGLHSTNAWHPPANARSIASKSNSHPASMPSPSRSIGTSITSTPHSPGTLRNGMYAGVGTTIA